MTYKYSDVHTLGLLTAALPVPIIPDVFRESVFTVSFRNIGTGLAVVSLIGSNGERTAIPVPPSNNGIVLDTIPWDTIANGAEGSATIISDVYITIIEQKQPQLIAPIPLVVPKEQKISADEDQFSDGRDAYVVVY
jgi:hypothetical protein